MVLNGWNIYHGCCLSLFITAKMCVNIFDCLQMCSCYHFNLILGVLFLRFIDQTTQLGFWVLHFYLDKKEAMQFTKMRTVVLVVCYVWDMLAVWCWQNWMCKNLRIYKKKKSSNSFQIFNNSVRYISHFKDAQQPSNKHNTILIIDAFSKRFWCVAFWYSLDLMFSYI